MTSQPQLEQESRNVRWCKPSIGMLKCNVDASTNPSKPMVGVGMLMRTDQGELISCCAKALQGPNNSKEAKVIAIREALSLLLYQRLSHLMIETDAKISCKDILTSMEDRSEFGALITDCKR